MADIERRANALWRGDLRSGRGEMSSTSGALKGTAYAFATRFEQAPGTNPEELIAAAHAACFSMAFANTLASKGHVPESIETQATCTLSIGPGGAKITRMHLQTHGRVSNLDASEFERIAKEAEGNCPVSNLLRPGCQITLEAKLL